ncbi:MAG: hypothetical protein IJD26_03765, partial [Lachnospiraceae bacterium]|nr:hypothetical protein [Lachnospiraceae bacterium]
MKNRKKHVTVFLFAMMMLLTAGCGGYEDLPPLPTLAPTPTAEPEVDAPAPTAAPDAEYTKIVELDGEDYNQTSYFTIEGEGSVSVKPVSKSGRYSFCMSGRGESWHGISFPVADASGNEVNVVGKNVFMSMWVYHESGKPESFICSMQIKKPDGTTDSPIEITKNGVPSHTWTLIEGYLPVYANVTSPRIRMEMTSGNASFYFDDFRLTYDPNSSIMAKQEYNVVSFEGLYFDFENGENPFVGRAGTESLEIIKGGLDGKKCLSTTKRTANWHGPSIDLTEYGLAGVPIWVSFSATQG